MGLETGTYIGDLVAPNPTGTDPKSQGDDHLRLIKSVLQNTFPNQSGVGKLRQVASVKDYGAKGDGSTDDTAAINAAFASSEAAIHFPTGTYKVSAQLVSALANRSITGDGATLVAYTSNQVILSITGDNTYVSGLRIDGNALGRYGIQAIASGCVIDSCEVFDLAAILDQTVGIGVETLGGTRITNNIIRNLTATGNSTIGDGPGSCRAIQIYGQGAATVGSVIANNIIDDIFGEEGDAIQTLFFTSTYPFFNGMVQISGNTINNANRRGIKIQSSGTIVNGNIVTNSLTTGEMPNYSSCIALIASNNCIISENYISADNLLTGINISGSATNGKVRSNAIVGNTVKGNTGNPCIFIDYADACTFVGNTLSGGSNGLSIGNSTKCVISSTTTVDGVLGTDINITATNSDLLVRDTVAIGGSRSYVVTNNAPDCIVEGSCSTREGAGTGCIRTFVTATGSVYRESTNRSSSSTLVGDFANQYVDGAQNLSSGSTGGFGGAFYASPGIPSTSFPNKQHTRGDIAFAAQPSDGGFIGWVCTASGLGAVSVWKTFGVISA